MPEPAVLRTVLLVDDETDVRDITALLLKRMGFEVLTAEGVEDALAIARSQKEIHLLVTDLSLTSAGKGGEALADSVAQLWPQAGVIFISGTSEYEISPERMGPRRRFLGKPFSIEDLRRVTAEVLA